jgi:prevent-host-death family protein
MMTKVNIGEAKTHFSRLVRKVMMGEEVIIARDNKPVVKLVPVEPPAKRRRAGTARGQVWTSPDFDETLADFAE